MMRFIVATAAFLILSPSAMAQTPVTQEMANSYYQNCMVQNAPGMTNESKGQMCTCTSTRMMQAMSVEDIKNMRRNDQTGRLVLNKMLVQVYAPCIEYPARDHYYNTCIANPETAKLSKAPQALCNCLATQVSGYLKANGPRIFGEILRKNPNVTDPMSALTSDARFQKFAQEKMVGCVTR